LIVPGADPAGTLPRCCEGEGDAAGPVAPESCAMSCLFVFFGRQHQFSYFSIFFAGSGRSCAWAKWVWTFPNGAGRLQLSSAQVEGWGVWVEAIEIADVRICSSKLFEDLQAATRGAELCDKQKRAPHLYSLW